ncbi:MAG: DUF5702 domain-containing protein, partial [Oscillospiraceae bacterium]|nr:DUF5702 domain-containing protein [Oscillospiraceae bacterium]
MGVFKMRSSSRGAVSVFLTIILVPCIACTSLFVDLARVRLAKNLAESAGDLALNSLLTHYDFDLNDFYGLVASCPNIEEFYDVSAGYFTRMLKSQGLNDDEAKTLISRVMVLLDNEEVSDLLKMEVKTDPGEIITPVEGANLANPTVMKDQLIEFMKYRAPINIMAGFLEELAENSEALKDAEDDQELVSAKQSYYEAENRLMERAYEIYKRLEAYQKLTPAENELKEIEKRLNSYRDTYEKLHKALARDIFNTAAISEIRKPMYILYAYSDDTYDSENEAGYSQLRSAVTNAARSVAAFLKAKTDFENVLPEYSSAVYDIQYWAQNYSTIISAMNTFDAAVNNMLTQYAKLNNAFSYPSETASEQIYDVTRTVKLTGSLYTGYSGIDIDMTVAEHSSIIYTQITGIYASILAAPGNEYSSDKYLKYMAIFQRISTDANNKIAVDPAQHQIDGKSVNRTIEDIYAQITADQSRVKALHDALDGVTNGLDGLRGLLAEYKSALEAWEDTAEDSTTDMAQTDKTEIGNIRTGNVVPGQQIGLDELTDASIDGLKTRVTNIRALYNNLLADISDMKYGNRKLTDVTNTTAAKAASGIQAHMIPQTKSELDAYVESTFKFTPATGDACTLSITAANGPDLTAPADTLYGWMASKFAGGKTDNKAAADAKYNEYFGMGSDKSAEEQTAEGVTDNNIAAFGDPFGFGKGVGSLVDLAVGLATDFTGEIQNRRDSLFATEYAANMFSHYTYEKEGKYKLLDGEYNSAKIKLSNYDEAYKSVHGAADKKQTWLSTDPKDSYNKSLTTKMIDKNYNFALGAEQEYILYGKATSRQNVNTALTSIYIIRYILNTPSGFAFFWNSPTDSTAMTIETVSSAISTATGGVVPQPLIKAILVLVIIAFESANDIKMLKAGLPVKFIKTKTT